MHCLLATSLSPLSPSLLPLYSPCPLSLYNPILFSLQALRVPASWSGWRRWVRLPLGWGRGVGVWGYGRRETPPPLLLLLNLLSALPSSSSSSMLGYPNRAHGADDTVRVHGSSSSVRASRTCPQDPPTAQLETTVRRTPRKVPASPLAGCSRRARSAALLPASELNGAAGGRQPGLDRDPSRLTSNLCLAACLGVPPIGNDPTTSVHQQHPPHPTHPRIHTQMYTCQRAARSEIHTNISCNISKPGGLGRLFAIVC